MYAGREQLISRDTDFRAGGPSEADVKILDGASVVEMLSPRSSNTFQTTATVALHSCTTSRFSRVPLNYLSSEQCH